MKILIAFTILAVSTAFGDMSFCPPVLDQRNLVHRGPFCYQFHLDELREYNSALKTCKKSGGSLAMPKTAEIQLLLKTYLSSNQAYNEPVWIGLNDKDRENHFEWVDGKTLHKSSSTYTNWGKNQGTNHILLGGTFDDCVALNPSENYRWHDYPCTDSIITGSHSFPFICQYDALWITRPPFTTEDYGTTDSWSHRPQTSDSWSHGPQTTDSWSHRQTTDSWSHRPETTDSWSHGPQTSDSWSHGPQTSDSWSHGPQTTDSWSHGPQTTNSWNNPSQTSDSGTAYAQTTDGVGTTDSGNNQPQTTDSDRSQSQTTDTGTNFGLSTDGNPPETTE